MEHDAAAPEDEIGYAIAGCRQLRMRECAVQGNLSSSYLPTGIGCGGGPTAEAAPKPPLASYGITGI